MGYMGNDQLMETLAEVFFEREGREPTPNELQAEYESAEGAYIDNSIDYYRESLAEVL